MAELQERLSEALAGRYAIERELGGREEESVATLRRLLAMPSFLGWGELRFDRPWEAHRSNAEFAALLRGLPAI